MGYDDSANERTERNLYGLTFHATAREYLELWLKLSALPDSVEWGRHRHLVALYVFRGKDDYAEQLAVRMNDLERAMERHTARLIGEMEMAREIPEGL